MSVISKETVNEVEEVVKNISINRVIKFTVEGQIYTGKYLGSFTSKYINDSTGEVSLTVQHILQNTQGIARLGSTQELGMLSMLPIGSIVTIEYIGDRASESDITRNVKRYDVSVTQNELDRIVSKLVS